MTTITLKIKGGCFIKQTFSQNGHGLLILPIKTIKEDLGISESLNPSLSAQELINEVCEQ